MIDYIRGILSEKEVSYVSVEAHGVGYEVSVPLSSSEQLPPVGIEVKLYTHYQIREDAHKLFGFISKEEREIFRQLIAVNQIGPRIAMAILSAMTIDALVQSIAGNDPARLVKVPGVGAKTAQRIVMELHGKLKFTGIQAPVYSGAGSGSKPLPAAGDEAFEALVSLGYNEKQVEKAIARVKQTIAKEALVEEWIKKALQVI